MNKNKIILLCSLMVVPFFSYADRDYKKQEVYVAGSYSHHKFDGETGQKLGLHVGAKNIYKNGLFFGGEVEISGISNSNLEDKYSGNLKERYALAANVPLGKRLSMTETMNLDLYGLLGYSHTSINVLSSDTSVKGLKWGIGADLSTENWQCGLRFTDALVNDAAINSSGARDQNLTLMLGYKF